ncbi:MAG: response regulator, partial [Thermomicrobiales bacterium]|nr:response regulator [Thermomicrobiales bacterium]
MTAGGARILVIDDEPQIRRALQTALTGHGYNVETAVNGSLGLAAIATWAPDAVVLDLVMPVMDGFEVLRQLRAWSDVPVIVLSARGQEPDKVVALDQGADDYLTKPFGMGELLARLRVVLRRQRGAQAASLRAGDVLIDLEHRRVERAGEEVRLTPTELSLLLVLARDAGKVLTHRQILKEVWGPGYAAQTHYVRVHMAELRKKV